MMWTLKAVIELWTHKSIVAHIAVFMCSLDSQTESGGSGWIQNVLKTHICLFVSGLLGSLSCLLYYGMIQHIWIEVQADNSTVETLLFILYIVSLFKINLKRILWYCWPCRAHRTLL